MKIIKFFLFTFILCSAIVGRQIDPQDELHNGIFNDSATQVQEAIKLGADPNKEMEDPLGAGSMRNSEDYKQSPLMLALLLKHQHAIQALLDNGAQPNERLVRKAIEQGYFDNALLFLKKKPTISAEGIAVCMSQCQRTSRGSSPLESNQQATVLEVMQQLINLGYNVNHIWFSETRGGFPEFYWNDNALKLFLRNGANPNFMYIRETYSTTPLFQAIYYTRNNKANLSGIKILLDAGANINQKANPLANSDYAGAKTPLTFAKRGNVTPDIDLIKLLQERGGTL